MSVIRTPSGRCGEPLANAGMVTIVWQSAQVDADTENPVANGKRDITAQRRDAGLKS